MKFKNATPRQLAILTALVISLMEVFIVLIIAIAFDFLVFGVVLLLLFVSTFLVTYLIIVVVIRRFIFRKIKLIYKNIRDFRAGQYNKSNESDIDMDSNVHGDVDNEVKEWTALKQKEIDELRTMENYRREFIGNVSHELKTPLFNIQGYIHTLIDGGIRDDAINEKYLFKASQNIERLITIVEDLDVITRLESGELIPDMQIFDIRLLIEEIFGDMELQAREKEITLRFKEGASNNFTVYADKDSIRTVMMNLISNSIKYGRNGSNTSIGLYDMVDHILIEVSDKGIGIEQKHLRHIFDRFYRVDKSRSRSEGGSGLGLAIVKHLLEAHNQPIHVRSTPGVGTTFGFTLSKN